MSKKQSSEIYREIQNMLCGYAQEANQWAQFSERDTPINAETFVQTLVLGWLKKKDASLNELAQPVLLPSSGVFWFLNRLASVKKGL